MVTDGDALSDGDNGEAFGIHRIAYGDVVDALRLGLADFLVKLSHYAFAILIYPIISSGHRRWMLSI